MTTPSELKELEQAIRKARSAVHRFIGLINYEAIEKAIDHLDAAELEIIEATDL